MERLLQDPTAKGMHRTNYTKRTDDDKSWELKPESDWVYTPVEPLISEELWDQCNQHLRASGHANGKPAKRAVHLFAGLTFCNCGSRMYVLTNSVKYGCEKCHTKIPAEDLEAIFVEQLKSFLVSPKQVDAYLGRAQDTLTEREALLENRKKEAEKIRQDTERTHRLYLDGEISADAFGKFFRPIEERQKQLDEELPRLQAEIDFLKISSFSSDQVMNDAVYLQERWPNLERAEKRKIVECITNKIVISKEEITIDLCYLPSSKELTKRDWSLGDSNP